MSIFANVFLAHHINTKAIQVGSLVGLATTLLTLLFRLFSGSFHFADILPVAQRSCFYGVLYCMMLAPVVIIYHLSRLNARIKDELATSIWNTQTQMNVDKVSMTSGAIWLTLGVISYGMSLAEYAAYKMGGHARVYPHPARGSSGFLGAFFNMMSFEFVPEGVRYLMSMFFLGIGIGMALYIGYTRHITPIPQLLNYTFNAGIGKNHKL